MRYVIMANGGGKRWKGYEGVPKQLLRVRGETLLERTTRLVLNYEPDAEVIISSADPACTAPGATRHTPERNSHEIDRFCYELIDDDVCFLYGDTYYTADAIEIIIDAKTDSVTFLGSERCILAVKVADGNVMRQAIDELLRLIDEGALKDARGWQLYHLMSGMGLKGREIGPNFEIIEDETCDFNRPEDWELFRSAHPGLTD